MDNFLQFSTTTKYNRTPVLDLIRGNLEDKTARHLMVISSGDSVIGILEKYLFENFENVEKSDSKAKKTRKSKRRERRYIFYNFNIVPLK